MDVTVISYDSGSAQVKHLSDPEELSELKNNPGVSWININGFDDIDVIERVRELFNIHPLSIEDILHPEQQPKIEIFNQYKFLSVKTIQREKNFRHIQTKKKKPFFLIGKKNKPDSGTDEFLIDQISIILAKDTLITFQSIPGDPFDGVRKRILNDMGEIRKMGAEYLAYSIIDSVVDEYFITLSHLEDDIENFEERATKTTDDTFIEEIQETKKYLLQIKRAISPLRANMALIIRHETFFQSATLKPFLRDLGENLNNAIIMVENHREWLSNIMEVNLSVLSHQMNKVMKVLATISTIFIPLTFIAGIYGMNFENMPELAYRFAYPVVLCIMAATALTMIVFFKIRHWF